jgi:hypothetical protein
VTVVPVPDRHALVVVRLMQQNPLTQEEYANLVQLGVVQQLVVDRDARDSNPLEEAFSLDAMTRRHNFAFTRTGTEDPLAALPRGVADRG